VFGCEGGMVGSSIFSLLACELVAGSVCSIGHSGALLGQAS
jgi:hypothetical protein